MTETERIDKNNNGELPDKTKLIIVVSGLQDPELILARTKEVVKCIAQYGFTNTWPKEAEWVDILPGWFVDSMTSKTDEELMKDENQWHFESWLDSIYNRAWVWWSSEIKADTITVVLETLSLPYLFEPLVYVFYSLGISMHHISVKDDVYG